MILSFYDKNFTALQNNASLNIDNSSYKLVKRSIKADEFSCVCEAYTENIQPAFVVVKNDLGNYIYGALAGIPQRTVENKTKITATDLKKMLSSDIIFTGSGYTTVDGYFAALFANWNTNVNSGITAELVCSVGVTLTDLTPETNVSINILETMQTYMTYYGLYMTTAIDLVNKKVVFTVKKSMQNLLNVKLWELGIYDYGKWIANINETQGVVFDEELSAFTYGYKWILTSQNVITTVAANRDIYPVKKTVILKSVNATADVSDALTEANQSALKKLTESLYSEDLEIENIVADFESNCAIYINRGDSSPYKYLPVGELTYDAAGLKKVKIGFRFTGLQFVL